MDPGDVIAGRFALEALAGEGGMGEVWRAFDRRTGARVAVKVLRSRCSAAEAQRLTREAQVTAGVRHPAVVGFIDQGATAEGAPFLAMEWLDGVDLGARLRAGPLDVRGTLAVLACGASALAAAHAVGVVHRDVKPQNLFLVGGDPRAVKLVDFGIARWDEAMYAMTRTGVVVGSMGYMAPEQARGDRDLDARVDVFALGCVAFACLTGRSPFAGGDARAVLSRLLTGDAPRARALRPDVPEALDALLAEMLSRDPARRLPHGAAVLTALGLERGAPWPLELPDVAAEVAPRA